MEEKRCSTHPLYYVEDNLRHLLESFISEEKDTVEVKIEEEKTESLKIRIISIAPDGRETEMVSEVPRPFLKEIPLLTPIDAKLHPKLIQPKLFIEKEVLTEVQLPPLIGIAYQLQYQIRAFSRGVERIEPLYLPYVPNFYYWFRDEVKAISLFEQPRVTTFIKYLVRLIDVPLKLSDMPEIEARVKIPALRYEKFPAQQYIEARLTEDAEALRSVVQAQQLRGIGLLELLIPEEREKLRRLLGASAEYVGEPIIIILPESKYHLWYLFWIICREIYREVRGAYPEPIVLLEKGCDLWLRSAEKLTKKIVILHERFIKESKEKEWFKKKLQEMFSQGLGFLIMIVENVSKTEKFIKELCKPYEGRVISIEAIPELSHLSSNLAKVLSVEFGIQFSEISKDLEAKDKIISVTEGEVKEYLQPDIIVARADRIYRDILEELLLSNYLAYVRRDVSEYESEDHVAMKVLAVKYLHERVGIELQKIVCTREVGNEIIADVYVEERGLAVECETLLGVAPAPLLKIFESVRKYIERPLKYPVNEIWVIIRNWPAILNIGDLLWAKEVLKRELRQYNKKVEFFIPDIQNKSLQSIDILREIIRPSVHQTVERRTERSS